MNYYERHLGDYARDTAHLTMVEHGAYCLLLDRCYATEQGIPEGQEHRLARARTPAEKAAVDAVLQEFFNLVDGFWINNRAASEIVKAQGKIKTAKENGKLGGRPKKWTGTPDFETQEKPTGLFIGSENKTQEKAHQTPDTRHQTPVVNTHTLPTQTEACVVTESVDDLPTFPTTQTAICTVLRSMKIQGVSQSNPKLNGLVKDGATVAEFEDAARIAADRQKPTMAYVLGIVEGMRKDAKTAITSPRSPPGKAQKFDLHAHLKRKEEAFMAAQAQQGESGDGYDGITIDV